MIKPFARVMRSVARKRWRRPEIFDEIGEWERDLLLRVRPYTLTSAERIVALVESVRYIIQRDLPGAFAECGVWRGGSVLAMVLTLQKAGVTDRDIYLYDTFEGMTKPSELDVTDYGSSALDQWHDTRKGDAQAWPEWFNDEVFNLELVKRVLRDTGYPEERLHFVRGKVEDTIPSRIPADIALLRLDTDWYESTKHEMLHLYPRLQSGGVLIIDDYGHWKGCRQAVDEYFRDEGRARPLLHRVDYSCRQVVKP